MRKQHLFSHSPILRYGQFAVHFISHWNTQLFSRYIRFKHNLGQFCSCSKMFPSVLNIIPAQSTNCPAPNGYFPDASLCDTYLECRDGVAQEVKCPDGLLVNVKAAPFRNPCDYPVDVDCGSRTIPCKQLTFSTIFTTIMMMICLYDIVLTTR